VHAWEYKSPTEIYQLNVSQISGICTGIQSNDKNTRDRKETADLLHARMK
jgi:hypothetical protein